MPEDTDGQRSEAARMRFPRRIDALSSLFEFSAAFFAANGVPAARQFNADFVLEELFTNLVKYNAGVMGKNWLHLQDGSGEASKGNHDITVTSQDTAAKGDVVTIKGVLRLDKDFGSGYTYALIVEEAKVIKK